MGETLNNEELKLLVKLSESNYNKFKVGRVLLVMFYHLLLSVLSPILAAPIVYVLEGFDFHLIYNMRFFQLHVFGIIQFLTSLSIISAMFVFKEWHDACMDND